MELEFKPYVRKAFGVMAIQITKENIYELAKDIGWVHKMKDGTVYIQADLTKVQNIPIVHVGFWVTKMGDKVRCYSKKAFAKQFVAEEEKAKENADAESA